jgi:hypothetical protein
MIKKRTLPRTRSELYSYSAASRWMTILFGPDIGEQEVLHGSQPYRY